MNFCTNEYDIFASKTDLLVQASMLERFLHALKIVGGIDIYCLFGPT